MNFDTSGGFYFSFNRFWEFQIGSLSALALRKFHSSMNLINPNLATKIVFIGLALMLGAFTYTTVNPHHSIFVSLLTTLGTLTLIIFPKRSWVNQRVLEQKWLIGIGLISYPLYLWHWPLISFGQIITNGNLGGFIKILLILLALLLAFITFRSFEKYLRHGSQLVTWGLLIVMAFIASQGWSTNVRNGLEFREKHIKDSFGGRPAQVDDGCLKIYGNYQPNFCRLSEQSHELEEVLIGDSIAHNHFEGLAHRYQLADKSFAMIGWPGQKPTFKNVQDENYDANFSKKMNDLLMGIQKDSRIKTVFLSTRLSNITHYPTSAKQLQNTITNLRANGKNLAYIFPPPELSFDPIECIGFTTSTTSITGGVYLFDERYTRAGSTF
jgi:hypothetical protein